MVKFNLHHADHGITTEQLEYIQLRINADVKDGFFIKEISFKDLDMGVIPCGLYGPVMGDEPVVGDHVKLVKRSPDRPADRMIKAMFRCVDYVQAIGIMNREEGTCTLFTVYGGPLAPQNPEDPTCQDVEASKEFWSAHALANPDMCTFCGGRGEIYDDLGTGERAWLPCPECEDKAILEEDEWCKNCGWEAHGECNICTDCWHDETCICGHRDW